MLRPSLQSLFAVCAFFSVAFANALPNNGPVQYETVVVYQTITTCFLTSSVYTIPPPPTSTCTSTPGGALISPPPPPPPQSTSAPSQEYTTSTVYVTTVRTITSCATTVTNCPATESTYTYVVTDTLSSYTTICPVTATQTPSGPGSSSYPASPPPYSSSSPSVSKSYSQTSHGSTGPSSSASASSSYSVGTWSTSSGSSVSTVKPTSSSVAPYSSSSLTTSSSYGVASSSSSVSAPYSTSSPSTSSSKSTVQSTSSTLSSSSSSPTYSASQTTSSTVSVPSSSSSPAVSSSSSTSSTLSSSSSSISTSTTSSSSSPTPSSSSASKSTSTTSSSSSSTPSSSSASKSTSTTSSSSSPTLSSSSASKSTTTTSSSTSTTSSSSSKSSTSSTKSSTTSSSTSKTSSTSSSTPTPSACSYWMENIKHQGVAPYAGSGYQVFRNVKDPQWGAKGDGIHDDTAAIQLAISTGSNCPPDGTCGSSSTTPALVYFPPGTYVITSTIDLYYGSSLVGNPNCPPVLKANSTFNAPFLIDGDKYQSTGNLAYGATNTFWRQFRNFVIDITAVPANLAVTALHWPTAQATSVENVVFKMSAASGTQHGGILSEQGSGGFMGNLTFYGGIYGLDAANQQFTMRNFNFFNAVTAIKQDFNWGWVYKGISISNCQVGIQFGLDGNPSDANYNDTTVSSLTLIDSSIVNTPVGISLQVRNELASRPSEESLIIENLSISNVPTVVGEVAGPALLLGTTGSTTIAGWGRGNSYTATAHSRIQGNITPASRPGVLQTSTGAFYTRSKPQYETYQNTSFVSVRTAGAKGDGATDDTDAIISAITLAQVSGSIVYFDAGYYVVSRTIYIPPGSKITGEGYPVILATGSVFANIDSPVPVIQVGKAGGEKGTVEWSNMIVSTKGSVPGAILIEWNLDATGLAPAGMWDVHSRIGGFVGSDLQLAQCPTGTFDSRNGNVTMTSANLPRQCIGAFMSMHVTKPATGLYMENVWLWVADHDVDDPSETQITIFAGRGLLVESTAGAIWMYGTAVEHHALYQYQLANTANIYMGEIQTETPYYQPNPNTAIPFPAVPSLNDPPVESDALGLRILGSKNILIYGAGLYSFFSNYYVHCSDAGNGEWCQSRIFSVEESTAITVYGLNTVGTQNMITVDGTNAASYVNNVGATEFIDTIAVFKH